MAGAVIAVELMGDAGSGERRVVIINVFRRGVLVFVAEKAGNRAFDVAR